ncbi:MAG: RES domain-containing protein [Mesorhizobium sp.]|uniref:RES family NAD+ phosphorylase n=1 Tax=Mesorhizobium sp. TaxID=1871066 RepID=UPI00120B71E2|nr:RES family NAD+ phosphorylase [Mesorhizobium sp.]TIQ37073.1 MAG: RES domain-containing protein [Mesorhizobium sp.]
MPGVPPPPDFEQAELEIETIPPGRTFGRIYWGAYPDPLGYGKSPSRFSDPRRGVDANRFGVLYLGDSLKMCFLEAVLRDQREGLVDEFPIDEVELTQGRYAEIATTADIRLADLRNDNAVRMGVPTDVVRAQRQNLARRWSVAFHEHPSQPDGIVYPSRLNGATNLAVYDRAIRKLRPIRVTKLLGAPGLARVLEDFKVGLA